MRPYSQEVRERILQAIDQGMAHEQAAAQFHVSLSAIQKWLRQRARTGHIHPKPMHGRPAVKREILIVWLAQLEIQSSATVRELCTLWKAQGGIKVSRATMGLARLHWKTQQAGERKTEQRSDEQHQHEQQPMTHQVLADGRLLYEGENWPDVFLTASMNRDYGTIVHMENGMPLAMWGPVLYLSSFRRPLGGGVRK
jgi:transposase